jgi:metal-responsive CopG/Arc/MetJ family transcriptional regulator
MGSSSSSSSSSSNLYLYSALLNSATKCFTDKKKESKATKQKYISKNNCITVALVGGLK